MDASILSADAFLACMIADAIAATTPPRETPAAARTRAAIIADMLRALSSAGDEKTRARLQSSMNGLSKTAHQWLTLYQTTQARRLAAQAARDGAAEDGAAPPMKPRPAGTKPAPRPAARMVPEPAPMPLNGFPPPGAALAGLVLNPAATT